MGTAWRGLFRAGWGFADQALSSLTNFALGIVVARTVAPVEFGAFALAFAVFVMSLNGSRAMTSLPLTIRHSGDSVESLRSATAAAAGTAAAIGALAGLGCLAVAAIAGGPLGAAFLGLGLTLPGLLLQDVWRFAFFARGSGRDAFVNDGIWALLLLPGLALASATGHGSVLEAILVWGASASVAAVVGIVQSGVRPAPLQAARWLRGHRDLVPRYVGEFLTSTGGDLVQPAGITAVAGLQAVGALRAGELLLGPFNIVFQGLQLVAIPEGVRLLRRSASRLGVAAIGLSLVLGLASLAWAVILLLIPDQLGILILGTNWEPARTVLLQLCIALVALGAMSGATIGLRVLAAVRRTFRTRLVTTTGTVIAVVSGAAIGGAPTAAAATAISGWIVAGIWWWQFRAALGEFRPAGLEPDVPLASDGPARPAAGSAIQP